MTQHLDDPVAQRCIVGCAIATPAGAHNATRHGVTPDHLTDPMLRTVYAAAIQLPDHQWNDDELLARSSTDRRIDHLARTTGHPRTTIARLVREAPVLWDTAGSYARRVLAAAAERDRIAALAAELEAAGYQIRRVA